MLRINRRHTRPRSRLRYVQWGYHKSKHEPSTPRTSLKSGNSLIPWALCNQSEPSPLVNLIRSIWHCIEGRDTRSSRQGIQKHEAQKRYRLLKIRIAEKAGFVPSVSTAMYQHPPTTSGLLFLHQSHRPNHVWS